MKAPTRFPGISGHARSLGVSQSHLYRILSGKRPFPPELKTRYELLLLDEATTVPFSEYFSSVTFSAEKIKAAVEEFGDAVAVRGNVVFFDSAKVKIVPVGGGGEIPPPLK
jgi:transcriptional regulator with XRE-family HTH domain